MTCLRTLFSAALLPFLACGIDAANWHEEDDGMSLLQLRATHNATNPHLYNGHKFGCKKDTQAVNVMHCSAFEQGVWFALDYQGTGLWPQPPYNPAGWNWIARSRDNSFQLHAFFHKHPATSMASQHSEMTHFAAKIAGKTIFFGRKYFDEEMKRTLTANAVHQSAWSKWPQYWIWDIIADGKTMDYQTLWNMEFPTTLDDVFWSTQAIYGGADANVRVGPDNKATHRTVVMKGQQSLFATNCFQQENSVAFWTMFKATADGATTYPFGGEAPAVAAGTRPNRGPGGINGNNYPWKNPAGFEIEGSVDFLDPDFGACARQTVPVAPEDMLITTEQAAKLCKDNDISEEECQHPPEKPPPPSAEDECEENGVEFARAETLCEGQKANGDAQYKVCLFEVCTNPDEHVQEEEVQDLEQVAEAGGEGEAAAVGDPHLSTVNGHHRDLEPRDVH